MTRDSLYHDLGEFAKLHLFLSDKAAKDSTEVKHKGDDHEERERGRSEDVE